MNRRLADVRETPRQRNSLNESWLDLREYTNDGLKAVGQLPVAVANVDLDPDHSQELIVQLSDVFTCIDGIVGDAPPKNEPAALSVVDLAIEQACEHFLREFSASPRLLAELHSYPKVFAAWQAMQGERAAAFEAGRAVDPLAEIEPAE